MMRSSMTGGSQSVPGGVSSLCARWRRRDASHKGMGLEDVSGVTAGQLQEVPQAWAGKMPARKAKRTRKDARDTG